MDLYWIAFLVLAAGAVLLAVLTVGRRRGAGPITEDPRERAERARELGWQYDGTPDGDTQFLVKGEDAGIKWRVRYRSDPSNPDSRPTLTWASRSVQGGSTELRLIGRERYQRGKAMVEPAIERMSSLILSAREIAAATERAQFIERTAPSEVGSPGFRERFTVVARNQRLAQALIDTGTEVLLLAWPKTSPDGGQVDDELSIWLDWQGLRIDLEGHHTSVVEIEHLVKLGVELAKRYRRHAASPGVTRILPSQPGTTAPIVE